MNYLIGHFSRMSKRADENQRTQRKAIDTQSASICAGTTLATDLWASGILRRGPAREKVHRDEIVQNSFLTRT